MPTSSSICCQRKWQAPCHLADFLDFFGWALPSEVEPSLPNLGLVVLASLGEAVVALDSGAVPLLSGSFVALDSGSVGIREEI